MSNQPLKKLPVEFSSASRTSFPPIFDDERIPIFVDCRDACQRVPATQDKLKPNKKVLDKIAVELVKQHETVQNPLTHLNPVSADEAGPAPVFDKYFWNTLPQRLFDGPCVSVKPADTATRAERYLKSQEKTAVEFVVEHELHDPALWRDPSSFSDIQSLAREEFDRPHIFSWIVRRGIEELDRQRQSSRPSKGSNGTASGRDQIEVKFPKPCGAMTTAQANEESRLLVQTIQRRILDKIFEKMQPQKDSDETIRYTSEQFLEFHETSAQEFLESNCLNDRKKLKRSRVRRRLMKRFLQWYNEYNFFDENMGYYVFLDILKLGTATKNANEGEIKQQQRPKNQDCPYFEFPQQYKGYSYFGKSCLASCPADTISHLGHKQQEHVRSLKRQGNLRESWISRDVALAFYFLGEDMAKELVSPPIWSDFDAFNSQYYYTHQLFW